MNKAKEVNSVALASILYRRLFVKGESIKDIKQGRALDQMFLLQHPELGGVMPRRQRMRGNAAIGIMLGCLLLWALTGCGSSTGWRVSFGVAPVKQIDDRQELKQEPKVAKGARY